jgi:hypothetical protein
MAMNFKSAGAYKKWLAYGHMHVPDFGKTPQKIEIRGKSHKVSHSKKNYSKGAIEIARSQA